MRVPACVRWLAEHHVWAVRKRRTYVGLLLLLSIGSVVGLLVTGALREREPTYGGKRLSEWVLELPPNTSPGGDSGAEIAIRHIGTNSLPYLMKWISYEPAAWRIKLYEHIGKVLRNGPNAIFQDKQMLRAAGAAHAFAALRGQVYEAPVGLWEMVIDSKRGMSKVYAAFAWHSLEGGGSHLSVSVPSGGDVFSLRYQTNGAPILTVSPKSPLLTSPRAE